MIERNLTLKYRYGLHARPSDILARTASAFGASVELSFNGERVNAKSVINLLSLGLPKDAAFKLIVSGPDEQEAVEAIVNLFDRGFDIQED